MFLYYYERSLGFAATALPAVIFTARFAGALALACRNLLPLGFRAEPQQSNAC